MSRLHSYAESEVNFYYVDENAKKANPSNVDTFNKLISHLQKPTQNCRYPQLYLVRGILVWIAQNQSYAGPDARYTTPLGFIQQLVRRRLSPADVFTTFCGLAVGLVNEPDTMRNCCEFKISCKEVNKNCQRFPACSGLGMYGHGYQAIDAGLLNSSEVSAKINMKPNYEKSNRKKQTVAKFKTDDDPSRDMMYGAEMHSNGSDSVDEDRIDNVLIGNTEVVHDKTRGQLVVNASIPKDGEYAVVITARDKKDKSQKKATPVVGYMVTTQIDNDYNTNEALINQRQKEIRSENNRKIKMEQRSILTALMDETNAQIDSLSVSGRRK